MKEKKNLKCSDNLEQISSSNTKNKCLLAIELYLLFQRHHRHLTTVFVTALNARALIREGKTLRIKKFTYDEAIYHQFI